MGRTFETLFYIILQEYYQAIIKNNLIYNIMFNKTKYDILITTIKEQFNYNDKEANRLIYHTTHFLLMDALIKKYNIPQMKAQILISIYNSQHNILF